MLCVCVGVHACSCAWLSKSVFLWSIDQQQHMRVREAVGECRGLQGGLYLHGWIVSRCVCMPALCIVCVCVCRFACGFVCVCFCVCVYVCVYVRGSLCVCVDRERGVWA